MALYENLTCKFKYLSIQNANDDFIGTSNEKN